VGSRLGVRVGVRGAGGVEGVLLCGRGGDQRCSCLVLHARHRVALGAACRRILPIGVPHDSPIPDVPLSSRSSACSTWSSLSREFATRLISYSRPNMLAPASARERPHPPPPPPQ